MTDNDRVISMPLPYFVHDFLNHLAGKDMSINTIYAYAHELILFFQYFCDTSIYFPSDIEGIDIRHHMENITTNDIEAYLNWAATERNNGARALVRKQAAIKSLCRYLRSEYIISEDVTLNLKPIEVNATPSRAIMPVHISDLTDVLKNGTGLSKEQLKYYAYSEKRNYAIFLTFVSTKLHLSELCNLNLSATNLIDGYFEVIHRGKTTIVYFNTEVKCALNDYIENERQRYAQDNSEALFLSIQGKRISKRAVQNLVSKYMGILKSLGHNTDGFCTQKLCSTFTPFYSLPKH
jgi:site-specific recombinase XerD